MTGKRTVITHAYNLTCNNPQKDLTRAKLIGNFFYVEDDYHNHVDFIGEAPTVPFHIVNS